MEENIEELESQLASITKEWRAKGKQKKSLERQIERIKTNTETNKKYNKEPPIKKKKLEVDIGTIVKEYHNLRQKLIEYEKVNYKTLKECGITCITPSIDISALSIGTSTLSSDILTPSINPSTLLINTPTLPINTPALSVNTPTLPINTPASSINTPTLSIETSAPSINTSAPSINTSAPSINISALSINTSAPSIGTFVPSTGVSTSNTSFSNLNLSTSTTESFEESMDDAPTFTNSQDEDIPLKTKKEHKAAVSFSLVGKNGETIDLTGDALLNTLIPNLFITMIQNKKEEKKKY